MKHLLFIFLFFSLVSLDSLTANGSDAKSAATRLRLDQILTEASKRYHALDGIAIEAIKRECSNGIPTMMLPKTTTTTKIINKSYFVAKKTNFPIPFKLTAITARLYEPEESYHRVISKNGDGAEKRIANRETNEDAALDYRRHSNPFADIFETSKNADIEIVDQKSSSLQKNVWRITLSFKTDADPQKRILEIDKETGIIVFDGWYDQGNRPSLIHIVKSIHRIEDSLALEREIMELKIESSFDAWQRNFLQDLRLGTFFNDESPDAAGNNIEAKQSCKAEAYREK